MRKFMKRAGVAIAALMAGALAMGGVAYAFPSFFWGHSTEIQHDITENAPWNVPAAAGWVDVPSTTQSIVVPAGTWRMVEGVFGAESICQQTPFCTVRFVYVDAAGVTTEFSPQVGVDFAFDSPPGGGGREQHSMHRVTRLGPGTYTLKVQALVPVAGGIFTLDDYTTFYDLIVP